MAQAHDGELMTTSASFIACDDIRQEATGKDTLIGVYGDDIIVESFPASLEHLYLRVNVRSPIDQRHVVRSVRVERPGLDDFEKEIPETEIGAARRKPDKSVMYFDTYLKFDIGPMEVPRAGRIRVFVATTDEEIYAGSIRVSTLPEEEQFPFRDVAAAIAAVKLFADAEASREQDSPKLALEIMRALVKSPVTSLPVPKHNNLILRIGENRFRFLTSDPKFPEDNIRITEMPEGYTSRVLSRDKFGFVMEFSPSAPPISQFSLEVETEDKEVATD